MNATRCGLLACLMLITSASSADEPKVAVAVAAGGFSVRTAGQPMLDRWIVDPQDNVERFLLLTPAGPLVVEIAMTVDGEPFRLGRERLVDELLQQADKNGDGVATWAEGFSDPRFGFGRFGYLGRQNEQQREQFIKAFDRNQNGRLDRGEARAFLAQNFGGATFGLQAFNFQQNSPDGTRKLLDTDSDGTISSEELALAAERLRTRDGDDNELLYAGEITGQANGAGYQFVNGRAVGQQSMALLLGPTMDAPSVFNALLERYKGSDGLLTAADLPLTPSLVPTLDVNGNGQLDQDEVGGLNAMSPDLRLRGEFGDGANVTALSLVAPSAELGPKDKIVSAEADSTQVKLAGVELRLFTPPPAPAFNFQAQADATMNMLDANKNGYIEKEEAAGNQGYAMQFDLWDADADAKVYPTEIKTFFERQFAPTRTQISALVSQEADPLFAALDANGDGRLSLREMRSAATRLKTFDTDQDGQISAVEVPSRISVSFSRGQAQYGRPFVTLQPGPQRNPNQPGQPPADAALAWFARMDRNGDGDLSPREFLGTAAQFSRFDADHDGLIDRTEAQGAK